MGGTKLLLLYLQPGLFQRQLSALRGRFLLQLLGAEIDLLLRQSSLLEPTGLLLGQCLAKLPRLFGKPLLLQRQPAQSQLGLERLLDVKLPLLLPELPTGQRLHPAQLAGQPRPFDLLLAQEALEIHRQTRRLPGRLQVKRSRRLLRRFFGLCALERLLPRLLKLLLTELRGAELVLKGRRLRYAVGLKLGQIL